MLEIIGNFMLLGIVGGIPLSILVYYIKK